MGTRPIGTKRPRGTDTWQLVAELDPDPKTGRRRQKTRTFHGTAKDADKALLRFVLKARDDDADGGHVEPSTATVAELLDQWMAIAAPDMSPATVYDFERFIERSIRPTIGTITVVNLDVSHLERLYTDLRDHGGTCRLSPSRRCSSIPCAHGGGGPLAPATVKKVHVILHAALEQACRWRWITRNPADDLTKSKRITVRRKKPVPAASTSVAGVTTWLRDNDVEMWAFTVIATKRGPRPGEVCALRWTDIDLDAGQITFARNIARRRGGWVEKTTKTDGERTIALVGQALAAVQAHRLLCVKRALQLEGGLAPDAFLFTHGAADRPWQPGNIARRLRRSCESAEVSPVTFRQLRHHVATTLITKGVDPKTVAGTLGHARASTTIDVYSDWVPAADRAAAMLLDDVDEDAR